MSQQYLCAGSWASSLHTGQDSMHYVQPHQQPHTDRRPICIRALTIDTSCQSCTWSASSATSQTPRCVRLPEKKRVLFSSARAHRKMSACPRSSGCPPSMFALALPPGKGTWPASVPSRYRRYLHSAGYASCAAAAVIYRAMNCPARCQSLKAWGNSAHQGMEPAGNEAGGARAVCQTGDAQVCASHKGVATARLPCGGSRY